MKFGGYLYHQKGYFLT